MAWEVKIDVWNCAKLKNVSNKNDIVSKKIKNTENLFHKFKGPILACFGYTPKFFKPLEPNSEMLVIREMFIYGLLLLRICFERYV